MAKTQQAHRVTILLNKPIGYVSGQAEDGYEPASVLVTQANHWPEDPSRERWHPGHARGIAPAGRLDIDSTGLLVLTQDGRIARHLIGEDSDVEKEYLVRVSTRAAASSRQRTRALRHGLNGWMAELRPAKVSWANEDQLRFVLRARAASARSLRGGRPRRHRAQGRVRIGSVSSSASCRPTSGATCAKTSATRRRRERTRWLGLAPAPPHPARPRSRSRWRGALAGGDRQRRLGAGLPRHGHRHRQAECRGTPRCRTTCST